MKEAQLKVSQLEKDGDEDERRSSEGDRDNTDLLWSSTNAHTQKKKNHISQHSFKSISDNDVGMTEDHWKPPKDPEGEV